MAATVTDGWVRGVYLEDGTNLWWIVRVDESNRSVLLENALHPEMPLLDMKVSMLVADGFKVVEEAQA